METDSRTGVSRNQGGGEMQGYCLMDMGFLFGVMKES